MKSILFAASSYGAFNVVYPVLRACAGRYKIGYIGPKPIIEKDLIYKKIISGSSRLDYSSFDKFDIFVTGSSADSDIDFNLWEKSYKTKKRSICILDQHKDIQKRFVKEGRYFLPDTICVMNRYAKDELLRSGIRHDDIIITGSPYLKDIASYRLLASEIEALGDKKRHGNKKIITFCSEYMANEDQAHKYGYDEHSVLKDICRILQDIKRYSFIIYIRVHPNDSKEQYRIFLTHRYGDNIKFRISENDSEYKILQTSDIVIGMSSSILIVASLLGLPIIGYQPMNDAKDIFIYDNIIRENLICNRGDLKKAIARKLSFKKRAMGKRNYLFPDALSRILDIIAG